MGPFKHYLPGLIFLAIAFMFWTFPILAAFILSSFFIFIGISYLFIVYRFHQLKKTSQQFYSSIEEEFQNWEEPSFKRVTLFLSQKGSRWLGL